MQVLKQFSIPIKGLKIGHHDYAFSIDQVFFAAFENSMYKAGSISAEVALEKKTDHLVLDLDIRGTLDLECDRCMDLIAYPLEGSFEFLVKYDVAEREEEEVVYIHPESTEFNCAKLLYDAVVLCVPMVRTCDEIEKDCNPDVLKHFESKVEPDEGEMGLLGEALKNLKLN